MPRLLRFAFGALLGADPLSFFVLLEEPHPRSTACATANCAPSPVRSKWLVTLSPEHIETLGWKHGEELESRLVPSTILSSKSSNWSGYAVTAASGDRRRAVGTCRR